MKVDEIVLSETPDMNKLPGGWIPDTMNIELNINSETTVVNVPNVPGAYVIKNALTDTDCDKLIELFLSSHIAAPVSVQGNKDVPDDRIGSVRATGWCLNLSSKLWKLMKPFVPKEKLVNIFTSTDWWQNGKQEQLPKWKAIGLTPMLRFMKYEKNGQHYAHYDAGYIYRNPDYRSLMSFVLYLTTNTEGGATRFINDKQQDIPVYERNHEDWTREVNTDEVIAANYPVKGDILFFDHRICHDVESYHGNGPRIIIRGDILFESM